jgi:site-specific DNA-methyltransferase (adenine-specific)
MNNRKKIRDVKSGLEAISPLDALVSPPSVHFTSKTNEWETPSELFNKLNDEFNFTLDPCCTKENAKCERHYTIAEDGLKQSWKFERVFMNPPYGDEIGKWIRKAYMEGTTKGRADVVVCLIPAGTDTKYWHEYIFDKASEIRFLKGRVKFVGGKFTAPFPSAIVVYKYEEKKSG